MDYAKYCNTCANWSTTSKCIDYTMSYPVVDYSEYANNFDKFRDKYPYLTIETYCKAFSSETFGDKCKGQFGTLEYETINFNRDQYLEKYVVNAHESAFWYDVGAELGIGFKKDGSKLIIRPFVNAWMYSGGAVWRCLEVGLSVTKVTFIPKSSIDESVDVSLPDSIVRGNGTNETISYSHE